MVGVLRRSAVLLVPVLLAIGGCSGDDEPATRVTDPTLTPTVPVTAPARPVDLALPLCAELPDPADSLDWTGVQWSDFPDPAVTRGALALALEFPYVVAWWGGTDQREGWIVIGVDGGAVELQTMLDTDFPGARVLAMPLDWTLIELRDLAARVDDATLELALPAPATVSMSRGLVRVDLGQITDEGASALESFAGERVCIDGEFA